MKIVKIIFGVLAGLFALAHCVYFPFLLLSGATLSEAFGSLTGLCIGAAVALALFRSAFRTEQEDEISL